MSIKLGDISFITKLAGFEHTKYIQGHISHQRDEKYDTPLFIGKTVKNGKIDKNYDWYLPHSVSDKLPRSQLTKKCLVMPYVGSLGDLAIFEADERCHLGSNIAKIELKEECGYTEEFVFYFIKSPIGQRHLFRDVQGAIQKNITMEAIRDIELPNISLKYQNDIVAVVQCVDDRISTNASICTDLESMAKLLYDYWFVQFDFPDENGKPYKSSGGKMVWNDELKREIPAGWEVKPINAVANLYQPKTISEKELIVNGQYFVYGANGIVGCYDKYNHEKNEIAICCRGASCGQYIMTQPYSWITGNAMVVTPKNDEITREYLYYGLSIPLISKFITGSAQPQITRSNLELMQVVVPNTNILHKFEAYTALVRSKLQKVFAENQQLASLRDFLLPMLMNGQVKVGS